MTIEELKKKIEAIDVPNDEVKLTIHVNQKDSVQAKKHGRADCFDSENKGDIDVVTCIDNEEERILTIRSTEYRVLFLDIEDLLYTADDAGILINILKVCHEYMKSED